MKKKLFLKKFIAVLTVLVLTAGCGSKEVTTETHSVSAVPEKLSMLEEPEYVYEKVDTLPSIMVDLSGYLPESEKLAIIEAQYLPRTFKVCDKSTGEVVFTGNIDLTECPEDGEKVTGYADFSELTEEGEYYIEANLLGRSKDFSIKHGIYRDVLKETFRRLRELRDNSEPKLYYLENSSDKVVTLAGGYYTSEDKKKDVAEGCLMVLDILTGIDFFEKAYTDDWGINESGNKIPDILDEAVFEMNWLFMMQNPETGGVYASLSPVENRNGTFEVLGETTKATAYFCATMARFSYVYKKYDAAYSKKCLDAAGKAWKCMEANSTLVDGTQMFRAAVEMYRATGYAVYSRAINAYLKDNADKDYEERIALDGAITYMDSTRATDVNYCTKLMEHYMSRTEEKSASAKSSRYLVETGDRDEAVLLRNLVELVIVDYIIANREYQEIEENYFHYLCGRNPESEFCTDYRYSPDAYCEFLVLLGKLTLLYPDVTEETD